MSAERCERDLRDKSASTDRWSQRQTSEPLSASQEAVCGFRWRSSPLAGRRSRSSRQGWRLYFDDSVRLFGRWKTAGVASTDSQDSRRSSGSRPIHLGRRWFHFAHSGSRTASRSSQVLEDRTENKNFANLPGAEAQTRGKVVSS